MQEGRGRETLFIRIAVILVLALIGRVLWPHYSERLQPVIKPWVDAAQETWQRVATRFDPPGQPTPPPAAKPAPAPPNTMRPAPGPSPEPKRVQIVPVKPTPALSSGGSPARVSTLPARPPTPPPGDSPPMKAAPPVPGAPSPTATHESLTFAELPGAKPVAQPTSPAPQAPDARPNARSLAMLPPGAPDNDPDLVAARAKMVAAPRGTAETYLRVDPRVLARVMDRGVAAYNAGKTEEERMEGARLIYVAAVLGYGPARGMIAHSYPGSFAVRSHASAEDAVRFALDILAVGTGHTDDPQAVVQAVASYLIEHADTSTFAHALIDTLRGDTRLQSLEKIDALLDMLGKVRLGCNALATLVGVPEPAEPACAAPTIRLAVYIYVAKAGPTWRDDLARARALAGLEKIARDLR